MSQNIHARQIDGRLNDSREARGRKESGFYDEVFVRVGKEIRNFRYYSNWGKWVQLPVVTDKAVSNPLVCWQNSHVVSAAAMVVIEEEETQRVIKSYLRNTGTNHPWKSSSGCPWRVGEVLSGFLRLQAHAIDGRAIGGRLQAAIFGWDFHYQSLALTALRQWQIEETQPVAEVHWQPNKPLGNSLDDNTGAEYFGESVSLWNPWQQSFLIVLEQGAGLAWSHHLEDMADNFVSRIKPVAGLTATPVAAPALVAIPAKKRIEMVVPQQDGLMHYVLNDNDGDWKKEKLLPGRSIARPQLILHPYLKTMILVVRDGSELRTFEFDWESRKDWREGPSFGRQVIGEPALFLKQDYRDGTVYPMAAVQEGSENIQFYRYDMRHGHWSSALF